MIAGLLSVACGQLVDPLSVVAPNLVAIRGPVYLEPSSYQQAMLAASMTRAAVVGPPVVGPPVVGPPVIMSQEVLAPTPYSPYQVRAAYPVATYLYDQDDEMNSLPQVKIFKS